MRLSARALADAGVAGRGHPGLAGAEHALRHRRCGHCQLGPLLVCRDGPVVSYAEAVPLLAVKEL